MLSETTAKTSGRGLTFSARPGVIPELRIGTAVPRNVVVMIAPDKDLNIKALLGYPVAAVLGKLTFRKDGGLMIGSLRDSAAEGAGLWIGDESLLISSIPCLRQTAKLGEAHNRGFLCWIPDLAAFLSIRVREVASERRFHS